MESHGIFTPTGIRLFSIFLFIVRQACVARKTTWQDLSSKYNTLKEVAVGHQPPDRNSKKKHEDGGTMRTKWRNNLILGVPTPKYIGDKVFAISRILIMEEEEVIPDVVTV